MSARCRGEKFFALTWVDTLVNPYHEFLDLRGEMNKILARIPSLVVITLIFAAVFIRFGHFGSEDEAQVCTLSVEDIKPVIGDVTKVEKDDDSCVFAVFGQSGEPEAKAVSVLPGEDNPGGYGGKIRIAVILDLNDKVLGVRPVHHNETGSFIEMLTNKGFFDSWKGHTAKEALNKDVDTITGATMSTRAVISMVRSNLSTYTGKKSEVKKEMEIPFVRIGVLAVLIFALLSCFFPAKFRKFRTAMLVFSVIFMGFLGGKSLSLALFSGWLHNGVSSEMWDSLLITGAAILVPFFAGKNFYCTALCPMGALQELFCKIPVKKFCVPKKVSDILLKLKPVYLYVLLGLMILGTVEDFSPFEPFSAFQFKAAGMITLIIAGLTLFASVFISKPWCRYFCPTGELIDSIRRVEMTIGGKKNAVSKSVKPDPCGCDCDNGCGSENGEKNA